MTDVLVVAIVLILLAIGILIWYGTSKKREAQAKPTMPWKEFFVTILALFNSFVVLVLAVAYTHGGNISQSWLAAGGLSALGVAGIVFAYLDSFWKRKAQKTVLASKITKKAR